MDEVESRVPWDERPGVEATLQWHVDPIFSVGGSLLCGLWLHRRGLSSKVEDYCLLKLKRRPGSIPTPYPAHARWGEGGCFRDADAHRVPD